MDHQKESKVSDFEEMHARMRQHMQEVSGGNDIRGAEIGNAIRVLSNAYSHAFYRTIAPEVTGPRWGILMRLMVAEEGGHHEGINPTRISHFQNVKKNTITSLLRGLEDQGLVERTYDPQDRRKVRIRISAAGRQLIESTTPDRLEFFNRLSSALTEHEKDDLLELLNKLRVSVLAQACENDSNDSMNPPQTESN